MIRSAISRSVSARDMTVGKASSGSDSARDPTTGEIGEIGGIHAGIRPLQTCKLRRSMLFPSPL